MPETRLHDRLLALEHHVWQALQSGDAAADQALLAPDFLGVYSDGPAGRADHCGQLKGGAVVHDYEIQNAQTRPLGAQRGLLTYRAQFTRPGRSDGETMYVTSIWEKRDGVWLNTFSQDTPAR